MIKNLWKIFFAGIIILLAYAPHFQVGLFDGCDTSFHLYRIYGLADAIKNGVFPVKVHALECYGYGVGFFYCNFFLYLPAVMVARGVSLISAYKIFVLLIMCGAFASVSYCAWRITHNEESAWFAGIIVMFSARFVNAFYVETALGTMLGVVFVPMAIAGMFLFLARDEKPTLLILGFIGIIFSHTISTFLAFLTCAVLVVVYFKI